MPQSLKLSAGLDWREERRGEERRGQERRGKDSRDEEKRM
jgi:hypothetical protein